MPSQKKIRCYECSVPRRANNLLWYLRQNSVGLFERSSFTLKMGFFSKEGLKIDRQSQQNVDYCLHSSDIIARIFEQNISWVYCEDISILP